MLKSQEQAKKQQQQAFQVSRRNFLKAGATVAGIAGLATANTLVPGVAKAGTTAKEKFYDAAPANAYSKLHPEMDYGGAKVRFCENNDQWLSTTQLVGKPQSTSEADMGFNLCQRGLVSEDAKRGMTNFIPKHPSGGSLYFARGVIAPESVVDGEPAPTKLPILDPEQMSQHIKDFAYFLRADEVGIGNMPDYGYYSHKLSVTPMTRHLLLTAPIEDFLIPIVDRYPYVIVVMIDQNLKTMLASTGYDGISGSQSMMGYFTSGCIAVVMADYIRRLGYHARAHHSANYAAVMDPCIMAAGLGELSRTGDCAIHPRLGFRHKVAAITTDLPLAADKPIDFGLQDFCRVCKKCADNCPSGAITHDTEPIEHNGYLRWNSDFLKCTIFRCTNVEGSSCGRCMKVCPWNSKEDSWFHQAGTWIGSHGKTSSSLLKNIDDVFGYGTEELDQYKWWIEWPELYALPDVIPPIKK